MDTMVVDTTHPVRESVVEACTKDLHVSFMSKA